MPIYTYERESTGDTIELLREFDEAQKLPTEEELKDAGIEPGGIWRKIISAGIHVVKGSGWRGGKGNWGWLLIVLTGALQQAASLFSI